MISAWITFRKFDGIGDFCKKKGSYIKDLLIYRIYRVKNIDTLLYSPSIYFGTVLKKN